MGHGCRLNKLSIHSRPVPDILRGLMMAIPRDLKGVGKIDGATKSQFNHIMKY